MKPRRAPLSWHFTVTKFGKLNLYDMKCKFCSFSEKAHVCLSVPLAFS